MCAAGALRAVFSYGSNSSAQLAGRLGAPRSPAAAASLPGWERVFVGFSALWGGAVASVARAEGGDACVRGAVCLLAAEQLALLDGFERGYERVRATALLHAAPPAELAAAPGYDAASNALTVDVYVSTAPEWMGPPSEMYCTAIAGMLREVWGPRACSCERPLRVRAVLSGVRGAAAALAASAFGAVLAEGGGMRTSEGFGASTVERGHWSHPGARGLSLPALLVEMNLHAHDARTHKGAPANGMRTHVDTREAAIAHKGTPAHDTNTHADGALVAQEHARTHDSVHIGDEDGPRTPPHELVGIEHALLALGVGSTRALLSHAGACEGQDSGEDVRGGAVRALFRAREWAWLRATAAEVGG